MTKTKKRRWSLKSTVALFLTGVMLIGEASGIGPVGASTVQAAEETTGTKITSLSYYNAANSEFSKSGTGAKYADVGFVMPLFNGKSCSELALPAVQDDLTLYVKQAKRTNGEWVDIDELVDYFKFNSTWGWEEQDWGGTPGWICWFRIDETTELKFQSNSNSDVYLTYTLAFDKLATLELTSLASKGDLTASAVGGSGISKVASFIFNGDSSIQYSQIEDDFNEDNTEILVKRDSETEFVPLFNNPDAGWIYDQNFGVYTNDGGGWWFANLEESITVRFTSTENKFADVDIRITYNAPARTNYTLSATNGTEFDAVRDDHSAVIGLCLPRIDGTEVRQSDLEKFVYQIKVNGEWKNLGDVWLYRENGYSNLSAETQWGYSVKDLYELWFKPVKENAELRIGYPLNGERGGDIGDNYIYYKFIGDPEAVIPDVSDMGNITIDNTHTDGDVTNVTVPEGWNMIWNDEFNGTSLNEANWSNQTGYLLDENDISTYGWGNKELEHYTDSPNNTSVANGKLNLTLLKEPKTFYEADDPSQSVTAEYSSGKVISQNKFAVKYGRVDIRAKLPAGNGIWPALWMMPDKDTYGTWARSGEIDIMEGRGRLPDIAFGTLHYGDFWPGDKEDGLKMTMSDHGLTDFTDWHVYSMVWEEDNIKIYCDGICYYKGTNKIWYSSGAPNNQNAPFDQQFFLILNLAAGGYFDGLVEPDADVTRKDMYVDYVRVFQKTAEEGDPDDDGDGLYGDYLLAVKVPLEKMTLDKTSISIPAGYSETITPSFEPSNATNKNITWTSSDESVATVSGGKVTGIKPGTATITAVAEDGNITKTCSVTVTGEKVTAVAVNPATLTLTEGETGVLTATVTGTNQNVIWTSSATDIATVDANGNVTAKAEGTATITVTSVADNTKTATCTVTVNAKPPVKVTGVTINKSEIAVETGSIVNLTATVEPVNASNKTVLWTSDNEAVATVSNGVVRGISEGTTTITATTEDGSFAKSCTVIVTKKVVILGDKGAKKDNDGNVILFVSNSTLDQIVAYRGIFGTEAEAADVTLIDYRLAGENMTKNTDGVWKYNLGKLDDSQYLVYAFNGGIQEIPEYIRIGDIPTENEDQPVIAVQKVSLDKTKMTLVEGENGTLTETVSPATATNQEVTWTSSKPEVATVDSNGKVTAKAAGTATITATSVSDNSKTATCDITVVASYTVTFKDGENTLSSQVVATNGTAAEPSNPTKAGYTFKGWLKDGNLFDFSTAITADTTLTAKWDEIKVSQIQMPTVLQLMEGVTTTITPTVIPSNAADTSLVWKSTDEGVAEVNENGKITAIKEGQATITVINENSGEFATCIVNVGAFVEEPSLYQVDFVVNGSTIKSIRVQENSSIPTADIPQVTEEGYTFEGWYKGNAEFDFDIPITKRTILVAKLTKHVTGVSLNKPAITLIEGTSETLKGTVTPTDATDKSVTWTSSKPDVATVDANGKVTAKAVGTTTITVTTNDGNYSATCEVTVKAKAPEIVAVSGVTINKPKTTLEVGASETLTATVAPTDATDKSVTWTSSKPDVATVDSNGKVTAKTAGTTTITVTTTDGRKIATCEVTVTAKAPTTVSVTGVTLNKSETTLEVGGSETLTATVAPATASNKNVTWTSSKPEVATVDGGKVTAVAAGETIIAVTTADGNYTETCKVTVTAKSGDNNGTGENNNGGSDNTPTTDAKDCTVTFDSAEGTAVAAKTVKEGEKAVKPEDPTRAGYTFMGWYVGEDAYNFDTAVTADITLTAKWQVVKITKIKVTGISDKIAADKSVQLKVTLSPTNAVAKSVTWKLVKKSDSKYANVNSKGKVTLNKKGAGKSVKVKATVTGLDGTVKTYTYKITIKKHAVKKLAITGKKTLTVKAGKSISLKSRVKITTTGNSVNKTLKWTTSDKTIATVSKSGKVMVNKKAKKGQSVKIKAQSTDGTNKQVTFTVKVK